jgi:hypothetical protein
MQFQVLKSKRALVLGATFVAVTAFASGGKVEQINSSISKLLQQFNTATSIVQLNITRADVSKTRATEAAGELYVKKTGSNATGVLRISAKYSYPELLGAKPRIVAKAELDGRDGNLIKILANLGLPQERIDGFYADTQTGIKSIADEFLKGYGDAAKVNVRILKITKNSAGNYRDLDMVVNLAVDLSKLASPTRPSDVPFTKAKLRVRLNLERGFSITAHVVMNKSYDSFNSDQKGLKEYIEGLLKDDQAELSQLSDFATIGNMLMEIAVGNRKDFLQ